MADQVITKQELLDAQKDAQTLEDAVNGEPGKLIKSRTGREFYSLASVPKINTMTREEIKETISEKVASVAGGKYGFTTLAEFNAVKATIPANSTVTIAEVGANQGDNIWNGVLLVKSPYDPVQLGKKYLLGRESEDISPSQIAGGKVIENSPAILSEILGTHVNFTDGYFINNTGSLIPFVSTRISDYIQTKPGESYTATPSLTYVGAVYDRFFNFLQILSGTEGGTATVTVSHPAAAFVRFNISTIDKTRVYLNIEKTELPWLEVTQENIYDAVNAMVNAPTASNLLGGVSFTNGKYLDNSGNPNDFEAYSYSDYIEIQPLANYEVSFASLFVGIFYDQNKSILNAIPSSTGDGTTNYLFTSPSNAKYLRINISANDPVKTLKVKNYALNLKPKSEWAGKTIAWYGTSIPAGYPHSNTDIERDTFSHANLAVHDLGGEIINKCVTAGGIGLGVGLSFVRTTDAINYQNSLLSLIGTVNEPNLVVFDYGVNDYDQHPVDIDVFDPSDPFDSGDTGIKTKLDTRDTNTFIGAHNTVIDAMLTAKPSMKFCFITHFSYDNASPNIATQKDHWKKLVQCQQALADYWSAPILNLHEKTGYRNRNGFNSITPVMPDHIHPASGDGGSVESLRNIIRNFLISIA